MRTDAAKLAELALVNLTYARAELANVKVMSPEMGRLGHHLSEATAILQLIAPDFAECEAAAEYRQATN